MVLLPFPTPACFSTSNRSILSSNSCFSLLALSSSSTAMRRYLFKYNMSEYHQKYIGLQLVMTHCFNHVKPWYYYLLPHQPAFLLLIALFYQATVASLYLLCSAPPLPRDVVCSSTICLNIIKKKKKKRSIRIHMTNI